MHIQMKKKMIILWNNCHKNEVTTSVYTMYSFYNKRTEKIKDRNISLQRLLLFEDIKYISMTIATYQIMIEMQMRSQLQYIICNQIEQWQPK